MVTRRYFLALAALAAGCKGASSSGPTESDAPPTSEGHGGSSNKLMIPPLATSKTDSQGVRVFDLELRADGRSHFLPGRTTPTWGINGTYLGPTVRVKRGERIRMAVTNSTPDMSTLHWHGMLLPAAMDGGPHQMIEPGAVWSPEWTLDQPAATLWYHPHPHGTTAMQVYRGLAGMLIVDDANDLDLPETYGVDDIPLIVQDKSFRSDGSLDEGDVESGKYGLLGDTILVNGTYNPQLRVESDSVRFRVLNASNARVYQIGFSDGRPFHVIGTDAGLTVHPAEVNRVTLSPGERTEIVVRFTAGENVVMNSRGNDDEDNEEGDFDLLKIEAADRLRSSKPLPRTLGTAPPPPAANARVRTFKLSGTDEINGNKMEMSRIDEVVPAGAREIWEVETNGKVHNFHIHASSFEIMDRDGEQPMTYERGPKDTVFLPPDSKVRISVRFGSYIDPDSSYMYHCHILRHEDKGMMGQFVVVAPGTEDQTPREIPDMKSMPGMESM